jgi:YegS/Rv2252/BmrU family lipid kinase
MRRFIVSGGDGTVVEAAEALGGTGAALAVLPGGTANLLAVNAGVPSDLNEALRLAEDVEAQPYDVGRANGKAFLVVAGMGADAEAVRETDDGAKERLGPLAYVLAAARNITRPPVRYSITVDGRTMERWARTVLVVNAGKLPGRAAFAPDADPRDGQLDLVVVRARGVMDVLQVGVNMFLGRRPKHDDVEVLRCKSAILETETAQPVQLDGNASDPVTRLEANVEPGALSLVQGPRAKEDAGPERDSLPLWIPVLAVSAVLIAQRTQRKGRRAVPAARALLAGAIVAGIAAWLRRRPD